MKVYRLVSGIQGAILDIDNTLYRDAPYVQAQTDLLVERLAREWGRSWLATASRVEEYRERYAGVHGGARPSLGNTFAALGIEIRTSVAWREELLEPEAHLCRDERLLLALRALGERVVLCAVTNNPTSIGRRTLSALGVAEMFAEVIGLDATYTSKPHPAPFELALERLRLPAGRVVAVGDRYEIDIEVPLVLGMSGVLVESMDDVYALPDLLGGGPA